jgi:heptosyltransferase-2
LTTPQPEPDKTPKKILILRYSSLGDVALTNPVLDQIQLYWPEAKVYYATKAAYAPAIKNHPALEAVIPLIGKGAFALLAHAQQLKALEPDLVLDLHDSLRSHFVGFFLGKAKILIYDKEAVRRRMLVTKMGDTPALHTIQKYLKVFEKMGIPALSNIKFTVSISKDDQKFLREFLEKRRIAPSQLVVGLGPGSIWATKRWLPDRYAELASRLVEDYKCKLLWFGSKEEEPLIRKIQNMMRGTAVERGLCLAGEQSLEQSIAILGRCDLFIGNDSGLTHLASGRGTRVVVIFGSTTPALGFAPWGPHTVVAVAGLNCRPCDVHGRSSCPQGHFKCMKDLTVDLVGGAVKRSMRRSR